MANVIEIQGLSKSFAKIQTVKDVSLTIPRGSIFALLGPNGAGKSTTIKMLMNFIQPNQGKISVLGVDGQKLGPKQLEQIGYVSENQEMLPWMTVDQFLKFCSTMYPTWNQGYCQQLMEKFRLPGNQKIKDLSRGMKMKVALISSIAYRPQLLILDEPFSGLDPLVREELITGVLDLTENENWTILLSSHDMEEVERLADHVGIMNNGELVLNEEIESLQQRFRQIEIVLEQPSVGTIPEKDDLYLIENQDRLIRFVDSQYQALQREELYKQLFPSLVSVNVKVMTLREVFIALAKHYSIQGLKAAS